MQKLKYMRLQVRGQTRFLPAYMCLPYCSKTQNHFIKLKFVLISAWPPVLNNICGKCFCWWVLRLKIEGQSNLIWLSILWPALLACLDTLILAYGQLVHPGPVIQKIISRLNLILVSISANKWKVFGKENLRNLF